MKSVATFASLLGLVLVVGLSAAADKPDVKDLPEPKSDADFLVQAVTQNNMYMRLSENASKNASDPKVREFADRMVKELKERNERLAEQAKNLKVAVLAGQEDETRAKLDQLGKLKGADYDRAYMQMMVDGGQQIERLYEGYSKNAKDTGLKTFTTDTTTTMKKSLDDARKVSDGLKK